MKDMIALLGLLYQASTFVNGKLTFNIEVIVTGTVDIRDPENNYILFVAPDTVTPTETVV